MNERMITIRHPISDTAHTGIDSKNERLFTAFVISVGSVIAVTVPIFAVCMAVQIGRAHV